MEPPFSRHLAITLSPSRFSESHHNAQSPSLFRDCTCCAGGVTSPSKHKNGRAGGPHQARSHSISPYRKAQFRPSVGHSVEESFLGQTTSSLQKSQGAAVHPGTRAAEKGGANLLETSKFADDWLSELSTLLGSSQRHTAAHEGQGRKSDSRGRGNVPAGGRWNGTQASSGPASTTSSSPSSRKRRLARSAGETSGGAGGRGAKLADLCEEDKIKIANLVKILLHHAKESQELRDLVKREREKNDQRVERFKRQNHRIMSETSEVRTKFAKSLQLLKAYQQRMASMQADKDLLTQQLATGSNDYARKLKEDNDRMKSRMVDLEMQVEEGRVQLKKRLQLERRLRELEGKRGVASSPTPSKPLSSSLPSTRASGTLSPPRKQLTSTASSPFRPLPAVKRQAVTHSPPRGAGASPSTSPRRAVSPPRTTLTQSKVHASTSPGHPSRLGVRQPQAAVPTQTRAASASPKLASKVPTSRTPLQGYGQDERRSEREAAPTSKVAAIFDKLLRSNPTRTDDQDSRAHSATVGLYAQATQRSASPVVPAKKGSSPRSIARPIASPWPSSEQAGRQPVGMANSARDYRPPSHVGGNARLGTPRNGSGQQGVMSLSGGGGGMGGAGHVDEEENSVCRLIDEAIWTEDLSAITGANKLDGSLFESSLIDLVNEIENLSNI